MHRLSRRQVALGVSMAGLGLMLVGILADVAYAGGDPGFGKLQISSMVIGSLLVAWAVERCQDVWLERGRRIAAGLWLLTACLGPVAYRGQWSVGQSVVFVLFGGVVLLSGRLLDYLQRLLAHVSTHFAESAWTEPVVHTRSTWPIPPNWAVVLGVGLLSGLLCLTFRLLSGGDWGDFHWALNTARSLLLGSDPYDFVPSPLRVPYPLPVALFGLPLIWLPGALAASLFIGLSSALLAYGILRGHSRWRLALFLAYPYFESIHWAQWSPLVTASWFFPIIAPLLVLVKPQTALPVALNRLMRRGVRLALVVLALSLAIYPQWPWRWLGMIGDYQRVFPVVILPLGPLLLLAACFPRDERARLLLLMSLLPLRAAYDLVPLFLIPVTGRQMLALVALSWLRPLDVVLGSTLGWQQTLNQPHFFALCILFWSNRDKVTGVWNKMRLAVGKQVGHGSRQSDSSGN